ncbi:lymphocyte activation gene 3 protein-like isoform X2 [Hoplias malabaricus]|uniref:lymphocyte activation gene 3 protein-like isoform X2 n=1 Tax=Hoplias malabaricus TaxID=27720 RepID=UPI003461A11C
MSSSKTLLWFTFALFLTVKEAKVEYSKIKDTVTLDCGDADFNKEYEWKYNDARIIQMGTRGLPKKGNIALARKAKLNGVKLIIPSLELSDSGKYSCIGLTPNNQLTIQEHQIYVVTASVSPSDTVLTSNNVTLKCEVGGGSTAQAQWIKPPGFEPYGRPENTVTLSSVTPAEAGIWTCQVTDNGGSVVKKMEVGITVIGPLTSPWETVAPLGGSVELSCFLPTLGNLQIVGGGWSRNPPGNIHLPTLSTNLKRLYWDKTNVSSRVTFSHEELSTNFSVTLSKLEVDDTGVYVCTVVLEGEKSLKTVTNLKVTVGQEFMLSPISCAFVAILTAWVILIVLISIIAVKHYCKMYNRFSYLKAHCERLQNERMAEFSPPLPRSQYRAEHYLY